MQQTAVCKHRNYTCSYYNYRYVFFAAYAGTSVYVLVSVSDDEQAYGNDWQTSLGVVLCVPAILALPPKDPSRSRIYT